MKNKTKKITCLSLNNVIWDWIIKITNTVEDTTRKRVKYSDVINTALGILKENTSYESLIVERLLNRYRG